MVITRDRRTVVIAVLALAVLGLAIAVALSPPGGSRAAADTPATANDTISLSGNGTVSGVPDTVDASFGVQAKRTDVQSAINTCNARARRLIAALRHDNVASKDIQTTNVDLYPHYHHSTRDGYVSSQELSVSIHPLTNVGHILTDATTSAGNHVTLDGISYEISDDSPLVTDAQTAAYNRALAAAQHDASLAGRSLGRVESIKQTIKSSSQNDDELAGIAKSTSASAGSAAASPVPIRPGQQPVSVTVSVVWALQ